MKNWLTVATDRRKCRRIMLEGPQCTEVLEEEEGDEEKNKEEEEEKKKRRNTEE